MQKYGSIDLLFFAAEDDLLSSAANGNKFEAHRFKEMGF